MSRENFVVDGTRRIDPYDQSGVVAVNVLLLETSRSSRRPAKTSIPVADPCRRQRPFWIRYLNAQQTGWVDGSQNRRQLI
jgi:hypothetical protein